MACEICSFDNKEDCSINHLRIEDLRAFHPAVEKDVVKTGDFRVSHPRICCVHDWKFTERYDDDGDPLFVCRKDGAWHVCARTPGEGIVSYYDVTALKQMEDESSRQWQGRQIPVSR